MSPTRVAGWRGSLLRAAVLLQLFLCAESLYEDQAGLNDFILENVGKFKDAKFHPDAQRRRLYFSTEKNFVGALESKTGAIIWRHGLAEDEPIDFMGQSGRNLVTISAGGKRVRVWNSADGVLLWDAPLDGLDETHQAALPAGQRDDMDTLVVPDVTGDTMDDVLVLAGREVQMRDGEVGKEMWRWRSDAAGVVMKALVKRDDGSVTVVGTTPRGYGSKHAVQVVTLNLRNGQPAKEGAGVLGAPAEGSSKFCAASVMVGAEAVVCLDANSKKLHAWDIATRQVVSADTAGLAPAGCDPTAEATGLQSAGGAAAFVFVCGNKAAAVTLKRAGSAWDMKAAHTFQNVDEAPVAGNVDKHGDGMLVQARMEKDEMVVTSLPLSSNVGATVTRVQGPSLATHGKVEALAIQPYLKKDGGVGLRYMLSTQTFAVVLVQADKVVWERQEALGHVVQGAMVDIPVPAPAHNELLDADHIAQMGSISRLVRRAVTDLQDVIAVLTNPQQIVEQALGLMLGSVGLGGDIKHKRAAWDKVGVSEEHDMRADRFGFNKVIVVLTEPSVLLGLHSKSGAVVWKRSLAHSLPAPPGTTLKADKFFLTRATGADGLLEATIVGTATSKAGAVTSFIALVHPLSGELLSFQTLPYLVVHAATVPLYTGGHARQVLMVVDSTLRAHAFPDKGEEGAEAAAAVAGKASSLYFYLVDSHKALITGYALAAAGGVLQAQEVWSVAFPAGERIIALAPQDSDQAVKSAGRVLGNRNVLLKYLNANLLAVATETPIGAAANPMEASREGAVRIYLIDTVVGAIMHSVVHRDASGPVRIVQTENVVVYGLWNEKKLRHEVAVLELYEPTAHDITSAAQMLAERDRNAAGSNRTKAAVSAWRLEKPRVLSQSYIMSAGLKALAVTKSMHGITSKAILMALSTDQLLSVDKKFLDPRRPIGKPTLEDQEEGLVPYNPYVPVMGTHVLSYHHTINGLKGMAVAPARIESTCSVVAYGVDIFYARVAPAKAYDCLGEDFNYPSLIIAVVGLCAGTYFIIWFSNRKELQDKWK